MERQRLIHEFDKTSLEVVKVSLQGYKSQTYVDLRVWLKEDPREEAKTPTKKGLTLNVELLPELIKSLQKAREVLEKEIIQERKPSDAPESTI